MSISRLAPSNSLIATLPFRSAVTSLPSFETCAEILRRRRNIGGYGLSQVCLDLDGGRYPHSQRLGDRKSTRLNSSHVSISYAVFCLKKKLHIHLKALQ